MGTTLPAACIASLAVQLRWLARRLEYHLLGNHLLANAKALCIRRRCSSTGRRPQAWARNAVGRCSTAELDAQVLADGGHFELSPMYHAAVLEDLLDLVNLRARFGEPACRLERLRAARDAALARRDDVIPTAASRSSTMRRSGQAPTSAELEAYARAARPRRPRRESERRRSLMLASERLLRARRPACGACSAIAPPSGPDYLPGHAHADTLSFEFSLAGQRVLVNSGTSEYGAEPERRGNVGRRPTIPSSSTIRRFVRGLGRVSRGAARARRRGTDGQVGEAVCRSTAAHDGYRRLPGHNVHRRSWCAARRLARASRTRSRETSAAPSAISSAPGRRGRQTCVTACRSTLCTASGPATVAFEGATRVAVQPGTWHPQFGVSVAEPAASARFSGTRLLHRASSGRWADEAACRSAFYFPPDLSAGSFRATALVDALLERAPPGHADRRSDDVAESLSHVRARSERGGVGGRDSRSGASRLPPHRSDMLGQVARVRAFARAALRHTAGRDYDLVVRHVVAADDSGARRLRSRAARERGSIWISATSSPTRSATCCRRRWLWPTRVAVRSASSAGRFGRADRDQSRFARLRDLLSRLATRTATSASFTNGIDEEFVSIEQRRACAGAGAGVERIVYTREISATGKRCTGSCRDSRRRCAGARISSSSAMAGGGPRLKRPLQASTTCELRRARAASAVARGVSRALTCCSCISAPCRLSRKCCPRSCSNTPLSASRFSREWRATRRVSY